MEYIERQVTICCSLIFYKDLKGKNICRNTILYIFCCTIIAIGFCSGKLISQGRYELNIAVFLANPMYEAYGNNNMSITLEPETILIDGKRLVNSDNFGSKIGYGIQVNGNIRLFKSNFIKALANIGYTQLESTKYPSPDGFSYGVRINVFSIGLGLQVNPVGIHKFYPSLLGLFRFNEIGAESFHKAGVDYLIVSPRFGYSSGITLNYKFNKKIGLSFGTFYNYDNWLNKSSSEGDVNDPYGHVKNFRDEASPTNGLSHNRRVVYFSISTGINIYFK